MINEIGTWAVQDEIKLSIKYCLCGNNLQKNKYNKENNKGTPISITYTVESATSLSWDRIESIVSYRAVGRWL